MLCLLSSFNSVPNNLALVGTERANTFIELSNPKISLAGDQVAIHLKSKISFSHFPTNPDLNGSDKPSLSRARGGFLVFTSANSGPRGPGFDSCSLQTFLIQNRRKLEK